MKELKSPLPASIAVLSLLLVLSGCGGGARNATSTPADVARPSVNISITPTAVLPGQNATLTWSSSGAASCVGLGSWTGLQPMSGSTNVILQGTATQTYNLECTGAGGTGGQSVTLALSQAEGACTKAQVVRATHGMQSRALAAARRAVATGTSGQKRPSRP